MPFNFTPDERTAIQIALADKLITLEDRLKSYEAKQRPSNHTRALIECTKSALNKVNQSPPDEA